MESGYTVRFSATTQRYCMTDKDKHSSRSSATSNPADDPHLDREAAKYANPVPSREFLTQFLEQAQGPMLHEQVADALKLFDEDSREAVRRRLIAMTRDGQLVCNRREQFLPVSKANLIRGRVIGHPDGYGFVKTDEPGPDLVLNERQMRAVFDGDCVLVRVEGTDSRGRGLANIVQVVESNTPRIVGRYFTEGAIGFIEAENRRIRQQVVIQPEHAMKAKHGQYVVAEIVAQPTRRSPPVGRIVEVLGDHMAPGMEIDVAIRSYSIPFEWPADVQAAVAELSTNVREQDKAGRIDIRHLPLVTIDGEDAKDFDDAVYAERAPDGGWRLYVAIADVSHYVRVDSPLDHEAHQRGTSVYFPGHVVPMLPEILSNGLCSLNPRVDRLCMVAEMRIAADGEVLESWFYEAVMHSHARLTYDQVGTILDAPDSPEGLSLIDTFAERLPQIHELHALYKVLLKRRDERGAIDFETTETKIVFGPERKIDDIVPVVRNDAHRLIEECMLAANVATAEFLIAHKVPALYRIHEGPGGEKLERLRAFLSELGLQLMGGDDPQPADYQELVEQIQDRPDFSIIQTMLLRSMSQAVYGPEEKGHFGLAYDHYTHFTSPIRRYPDLLVHRAIKSVLYSKKKSTQVKRAKGLDLTQHKYHYTLPMLLQLGEHCSMTERRADEASRDVVAWLKCEYLQQHIGEVFEGVISAVTSFGFFVELSNLFVEGLVHISSLGNDFYQFDHAKQRLRGERTGDRFGLGDPVVVQVSRVDLEERKIDLTLVQIVPKSRRQKQAAQKVQNAQEGSGAAPKKTAWSKQSDKAGAGKGKKHDRAGSGKSGGGKSGGKKRR
jgi:ribonuclease R